MKRKSIATTAGALLVGTAAGAGIMLNDTAHDSVKQALGQGATNNSTIGGIGGGITVNKISGMDLETAMMAVQSKRAELLESQLKQQLNSIQDRKNQIAKLNEILGNLNTLRTGKAPYTLPANVKESLNGIDPTAASKGTLSATELDTLIGTLKSNIDSSNNSQQMDMLKLQSLSNKRNEAFDLMTNFIKKMADSRSSVLGNMR